MSETDRARVDLFIYFRARSGDDPVVQVTLDAHRQRLASHGIALRLWRRVDEAQPGHTTWMEGCETTNENAQAVSALLAESAQACGLEALAVGPRHLEVFRPVC